MVTWTSAAMPAAERICEEMVAEFMTWAFHHQAMQPTIQAIQNTFEQIRSQEVERHHHRFHDLDRTELDRLTQSIIQKVLAVPVVRLKSVDPESIDYVHGVRLLHALFARPDCEDQSAESDARQALQAILSVREAPVATCPFAEQGGPAPCTRAVFSPTTHPSVNPAGHPAPHPGSADAKPAGYAPGATG